jgi:hypothetical protein
VVGLALLVQVQPQVALEELVELVLHQQLLDHQ